MNCSEEMEGSADTLVFLLKWRTAAETFMGVFRVCFAAWNTAGRYYANSEGVVVDIRCTEKGCFGK
jgi:hypothetical protein